MRTTDTEPWIVAHRGNGFGYPENSLAAFRAVPREFGVECDVWMTRDGIPVVHHNATVPVGGGRSIRITSAYRRSLSAHASTLDAVLETLRGQRWINIEIKPTRARLAPLLKRLARVDACISSYSPSVLQQVRTVLPDADLALLASPRARPDTAGRIARRLDCSGLHIALKQLSDAWCSLAIDQGLRLRVYTVNDADGWKRCADAGVAGVFTDRPLAAAAWLRRGRPAAAT